MYKTFLPNKGAIKLKMTVLFLKCLNIKASKVTKIHIKQQVLKEFI